MSRLHKTLLILAFPLGIWGGGLLLASYLTVDKSVDSPDALVVMAGNMQKRLPIAHRQYQRMGQPQILLTNDGNLGAWSDQYQRNLTLVEWAREFLLHKGVTPADIVILPYAESGSIHDARQTFNYLKERREIQAISIVTSDYHTRRSLWAFHQVFQSHAVEIGVVSVGAGENPLWSPLRLSAIYVEAVKYLYYRIRYRQPDL